MTCASFASPKTKQTIPASNINDGYCDCPHDGLDEPNTEACSGSTIGGWAGVSVTGEGGDSRYVLMSRLEVIWTRVRSRYRHAHSHFHHPSNNSSIKFTCPQQPNLKLSLSRINDGICDCCDGADETEEANCPDICDAVLKEEREQRRLLEQNFKQGNKRRLEELQHFQTMVTKTEAEFQNVSNEYNTVQQEMDTLTEQMESLKHERLKQRLLAMKDTIMSLSHESGQDEPLKGLLEPLSEEGLVTVIVQACQLAGEQQPGFDDSSTCVPLRLAGLDVGIVWGREDYKEGTVSEERLTLSTNTWQDLIDKNAAGEMVWSIEDASPSPANNQRRRLMEDDDHYYEDHHYEDDMVYDERWHDEEGEEFPDPYDDRYDEEMDRQDDGELNQELLDGVKANAFSAARLSFLNRASHLIAKIDDLTKDALKDEENDGEENTDDRLNAFKQNVDPMALQQVRTTLRERQEAIQRGLKYAVSAEILVKPLEHSHPDLVALAAGTLYHGKIRSSDLWQILAYMTVEFPTHACFSPWSILCPPEISDHNGTPYPPLPIVKAVEQFCEGEHMDASIICDTDAGDEEIPSTVHEHYYGYSVIEARDDDDILSKAFARLDNMGDRSFIVKLEEQRNELQTQLDSLSSRMRELEDDMGGRDHSKFGNQGELYSLRNSCHSVQEGKYDYEVCIFGRAQQKDHGQHSGTSLGRWKGISVDQDTGLRKMEWTNGAKCWNGPERSATVFVTCGAENKVFSAEEPDTCRYVLEMESYIACDDDYKQRHGL